MIKTLIRKYYSIIGELRDEDMLTLVGDFETTTDPEDVRVWASCLVDNESLRTVHLAHTIDETFEYLKKMNTTVFYHNLKFDGEFWVAYLFKKGFVHHKGEGKLLPGEFSTLISDSGQWYQIEICFSRKGKRVCKCTIRDSLKKLPFPVAKIAKSFNLPIAKGEIDYDKPRPVGYRMLLSEAKYIVKDCKIVASALKMQFAEGMNKMTVGADALNQFKESIGEKRFERMFPELPVLLDKDIRRAYKGGFVYVNPKYRGKVLEGLKGFDVNSLYPWAMRNCLLPFGYPVAYEGEYESDEVYPLYIQRIRCAFDLKPGYLPTIQLKNNRAYVETEYLETTNGAIEEFTLTSVDLELFLEHYNVRNLEYVVGYKFKACRGLFDKYIDKWMHVKETEKFGKKELAKLRLNSLYGKFCTNPIVVSKYPYLDESGVVKYKDGEEEERKPVYTPLGCFVTAWARHKTITTSQRMGLDTWVYSDTDSIYCLDTADLTGIEIHPTHLGCWKHEGDFIKGKFLRAKTYIKTEIVDGKEKVTVKCAGMPEKVKEQVTYENFTMDASYTGKLVPKRFEGGVVLIPKDFTIR